MWNGPLRCDGVHVAPLDTGKQWVICAPNGTKLYDTCPCCAYPMTTENMAKLVADRILPMLPEAA